MTRLSERWNEYFQPHGTAIDNLGNSTVLETPPLLLEPHSRLHRPAVLGIVDRVVDRSNG
jgi:hypothetical protein